MNLKPLGQAIKDLRNAAGRTQQQAATATGTTTVSISAYEDGYRRPGKHVLKAFLIWVTTSEKERARVMKLASYETRQRHRPAGLFGTWLAARLHSLGLNPSHVSRALQIADRTPYDWVSGRGHPNSERIPRLATLLGVPRTTLHSIIAQSTHEKSDPLPPKPPAPTTPPLL